MTATELLSELQHQGFTLAPLPEGKLVVKPAERLTDALREQLRQHKAEVLALLSKPSPQPTPSWRDRYRHAAESVQEDCFAIDAAWLIERHPELWQRLSLLDLQLTRLEQCGGEAGEYGALLEQLVKTVKEAGMLYERARQAAEKVEH